MPWLPCSVIDRAIRVVLAERMERDATEEFDGKPGGADRRAKRVERAGWLS